MSNTEKLSADELVSRLLKLLEEKRRLRALSNEALVTEVNDKLGEYLIVQEMMDRLDPNWTKR